MGTILHEKKIKSADRVLDILEMFSEGRKAVTVMDVSRTLNFPQSSTSELLGSLVRRGYLVRKRGERVFRPTSRVALLGSWVHPQLYRSGNLLNMMDRLREDTGLSVALCLLVGVTLKHVHTVGDLPEELNSGAERHLLHSPFGHVILSTIYRETVRLMVHRLNAESAPEQQERFCDVDKKLVEVSRHRMAVGPVAPGWSGIAILLPQGMGEEQLSLGIIAPTEEIENRRDELLRTLRRAISSHLGPRVVSESRIAAPVEPRSMAVS